jgi:hypothetical protein
MLHAEQHQLVPVLPCPGTYIYMLDIFFNDIDAADLIL